MLVDTSIWIDHFGRGDARLSSARLAGASLWTRDKWLQTVALEMGLAYAATRH